MKRESVFLTAFLTILAASLFSALAVLSVEASGTVYIRADGSVDPLAAPIQRNGNVYTLTGNITSGADGIVVERDDIVIDGAGYTIMGGSAYTGGGANYTSGGVVVSGYGNGTALVNRSNVTMSNVTIKDFRVGIYLYSTSDSIMSDNNITANTWSGIFLSHPRTAHNIISNNTISRNLEGIHIEYAACNNTIEHNNFINNDQQSGADFQQYWNNCIEGNYWNDLNPVDVDKDKIGDVPYGHSYIFGTIGIIRYYLVDPHPLIYPIECYESSHVCSPDLNRDGIVNMVDVGRVARASSCKPGDDRWNPTADLDLNELINDLDISIVAENFGKTV
jgi:parallel beta-helix repeat protein